MSALYNQVSRSLSVIAAFTAHDVQLPLSADPDNFGVIQDARGREVATIDVNAERPEEEVSAIIGTLVAINNASGGFPAQPKGNAS